MTRKCVTCDREWETLPQQAVLISRSGRVAVYEIDGEIHYLRWDNSEVIHIRWHKTKKKPGCIFCYPPEPEQQPEPELPVEQTDLLQEVIGVLEQLPEPIKPEVIAEPQVEDEPLGLTSMQSALKNFNSRMAAKETQK